MTAVGPDHEIHRTSAAAYVLGALDPSERGRFEAHLQVCETCRAEVTRFAPLPGLLGGGQSTRRLLSVLRARAPRRGDADRSSR